MVFTETRLRVRNYQGAAWCNGIVPGLSGESARTVVALLLVVVSGCDPSPAAVTPTPTSSIAHALAGGCAGTVVTDDAPPMWAQSGWSHTNGTPWPVPWASSLSGAAVAFIFATRLVAGPSPRVDGSTNTGWWLLRDGA